MSSENANTRVLLKAVQFAALKHQKQRRRDADASPYINHPIGVAHVLADKISNVRDVTHFPPAKWDVARRIDYLDWTEKVIAGCRGTNDALERHYDQVLEQGRAMLGSAA